MKFLFLFLVCFCLALPARCADIKAMIVVPAKASLKVHLAAKEVRRYFYLRTACLAEIHEGLSTTQFSEITFLLCARPDDIPPMPGRDSLVARMRMLGREGYMLETIRLSEKKLHVILGGDDTGVLYGGYALAEQMGIRFSLHGDVVPEDHFAPDTFSLTGKTGRPLFAIRGILPFHDFPEGPDWWNEDDYKAVCSQLPKLKMNFFGLHTYPEGGVGPEPLVWIGPEGDIHDNGTVKNAYPSRHFTTGNGTWGYTRRRTSTYSYRLGDLFEDDTYGTSYMRGIDAWPADDQQEVSLFNGCGDFFRNVFTHARDLGIKTCVGTETPLVVPQKVKTRLISHGNAPDDSVTTQLLYRGMFEWVKKNYPIDYYWLWTPEDWTWRENTAEELTRTRMDLLAAHRAAAEANVPFTLATCGWVLGPTNDRSYFDQILPKSWPMSCINRYVGFEPIDAGFTRSKGRPLWAIPWLEDDPALLIPQLWAGRMRRDAIDAAAYGCTGLIGIHWRTRILSPNVAALASAAWEQPWNPCLGIKASFESAEERKRTMNLDYPVGDFYLDWATWTFGGESAQAVAAIFEKLDGGPTYVPKSPARTHLPRPADWKDGPGGILSDSITWSERKSDYAFIETLEDLGKAIKGEGNRERYDYWLNSFKYLRAVGQFACSQGEIERMINDTSKTADTKTAEYGNRLISLRTRQIKELEEAFTWLIKTMSTSADLGTLANWEQHVWDITLQKTAKKIEQITETSLPKECWPSDRRLDVDKMIVPTVRTSIRKGEPLTVRALFYGERPQNVEIRWKKLGGSSVETQEFRHVARNVYEVSIPAARIPGDMEYWIVAEKSKGTYVRFPATENANQTVVVY
jgi:hypothetical protein